VQFFYLAFNLRILVLILAWHWSLEMIQEEFKN